MACLIKRGTKSHPIYYVQYLVAGERRRFSTGTGVRQIALAKLRQFESARENGGQGGLPTKTPIANVLAKYVAYIRSAKTPKSAQTDIYYLRDAFGAVTESLNVTSRKLSAQTKKRPPKPGQDRRRKAPVIEASHFEAITKDLIHDFIVGRQTSRGLAPKTCNRIRDTLSALFSWAINQQNLCFPGDKNPVAAVTKYEERAPEISFLTLEQVDQQLEVLADNVKMQAMVATLIYAGLRREELLRLTPDDLDWNAGKYGAIRVRAKTVDGEFWQPKNRSNRCVPISSDLKPYLDKWKLKASSLGGAYFFPTSSGTLYDTDNFSRDLRFANAKHGLSWSALDYRHTFGSQLACRGESLYKIATLMGNSPDICRRHYAALLTESLIDSVEFRPVAVAKQPPQAASA